MDIEETLNHHHHRLLSIPGVTGLGIGDKGGHRAIVIMVQELTPELKSHLPRTLEGHPVIVEESGEIMAF